MDAIHKGIQDSLANQKVNSTDQQVMVRYQNNTQRLGTFDVVAKQDLQVWSFNYLFGADITQHIDRLANSTLVVWENQSLIVTQIRPQVSGLINATNR